MAPKEPPVAPHEGPGGCHREAGRESEGGQSPRAAAAIFRKGGALAPPLELSMVKNLLVPVALVDKVNDVLYREPFVIDKATLLAVEAPVLLFNLVF
jgi:hypothetical protein